MHKTPFVIDPEPMTGNCTAHAGLAAASRVYRSLNIPGSCEANLRLKSRDRGCQSSQVVESVLLMQASGGDCMDDMDRLREDEGVQAILGYETPASRTVRDFLLKFHDEALYKKAQESARKHEQLAFIPEENGALEGLRRVLSGSVTSIVRRVDAGKIATVDQDATIVASEKRTARVAYEGTRGYQPMLAVWAETGLVLADEFRDGNVPARMAPLACAKAAFRTLPQGIEVYGFRGDSACYEQELLNWLADEKREGGPEGRIAFAVSAMMSQELAAACRKIPEKDWLTTKTEADGTLRQWAEVAFVPSAKYEHKASRPLRYLAIRLLKAQGLLFEDGSDRRHLAVATNRTEAGDLVLDWHREKAGTVEHVHDEIKNGLAGGHMPGYRFGMNAAWFRIVCLTHNVLTALRQGWADETIRTAKLKRLRFAVLSVTGRVVRDRRTLRLRIGASREWIQRLVQLFETFPLPTQATG